MGMTLTLTPETNGRRTARTEKASKEARAEKASKEARTTTKKRKPTKPRLMKLSLPKRKVNAEARTTLPPTTTKTLPPTTKTLPPTTKTTGRRSLTETRTENASQKVRAKVSPEKASQQVRAKARHLRKPLPKRTPPALRKPPKHLSLKHPPEDTPSNLHCEASVS